MARWTEHDVGGLELNIQELIRSKRDGGRLSREQIAYLIDGIVRQTLPDYQVSALLMAVFFQGMQSIELWQWTEAMLASGDVIDLSKVEAAKVDKHSTGGVGDKISICLAPLVASCGVAVPMISGRGLGHTGGTLDKLEAIPGFCTRIEPDRFARQVNTLGLCLAGQSERLVPADRRLYALRDVTATVESIPLIASSIMSKKLAEGIDALVLDVKVGSGAFFAERDDAEQLARTLCAIGAEAGTPVRAILTNMDQPLGTSVGNANETCEAIEVLRGGGPEDVVELTLTLGSEMLQLGRVCTDTQAARAKVQRAIDSGAGLRTLQRCIEAQGGDPRVADTPALLPRAQFQRAVTAVRSGVVCAIDTRQVGLAAMGLGAGRATVDDGVDPAVGVEVHAKVGDEVRAGDALATIHYNDPDAAEPAACMLLAAYKLADAPPDPTPLVLHRIDSGVSVA